MVMFHRFFLTYTRSGQSGCLPSEKASNSLGAQSKNMSLLLVKKHHSLLVTKLVGGLEPWNFMTFHILGMSSSQLTNSIIFQRGRYTYHQPENVGTVSSNCIFHNNSTFNNGEKHHSHRIHVWNIYLHLGHLWGK